MDKLPPDSVFAYESDYQSHLQSRLQWPRRRAPRLDVPKRVPRKRRPRRFLRYERDVARFLLMLRGEEEGAVIIREEWGAEDGGALIALLGEQKDGAGRR